MIKTIINAMKGKKSYCVAIMMIAYGVSGVYLKVMTPDMALQFILNGMGLGSLRVAIASSQNPS